MRYFNLRYFKRFKHFSFKYQVTCLFDVQANNYKTITINEGFTRVSSPLCLFVSIFFHFFRAMIHELERKIVLPWNKCYPRVQPNSSLIRLSKNAAIFIIFFPYFCRYRPSLAHSVPVFHERTFSRVETDRDSYLAPDKRRRSHVCDFRRRTARNSRELAPLPWFFAIDSSRVVEQLNWQRRKWQKGKKWFFTRVKYAEGKLRMME